MLRRPPNLALTARTRAQLQSVAALAFLLALVASASARLATSPLAAQDAAVSAASVVRIPITGTVELGLAPFVERALDEAAESGASAVILDLDTPGGRVDAAWQIIDAVRDASVPVYALVNRRALSAGAMIALSARGVYMRPGSTIGAATPVDGQGTRASEKIVSAMRSEFRALAEERGFDPQVGAAMVDEAIAIPGVVDEGELLTLTTSEAVELGVAVAEVADFAALTQTVGVPAGARRVEARPNWAEGVVRFLTNPAVAPLLLSIGFLGLLIEIKTPSFGVAGAFGLAALAAFFGAHHLVHLAGIEEILLFAAGIVLVALEVFLIPGFGIAGVLGGAALFGGAVFAMVGSVVTWPGVLNAAGLVAASLILVAVVGWALVRFLPRSRRFPDVFLDSATTRETGYVSSAVLTDLIGRVGTAVTDLRPSGTAIFGDLRVDVVTEGPWIEASSPVEVVRAEGYRHVVRQARVLEPGDQPEA